VTEEPIQRAAALIRSGAVVGTPTDTVYGIAADPDQVVAVNLLFELKGRKETKPIGILGASAGEFRSWVELPLYALEWAEQFWPGPLTLVARALRALPPGIGDRRRRTVGVRVPKHPVTLELLNATGVLAVTSANLSGAPETLSDVEAAAALGDRVPFYVPGICPGALASTVVDVSRPRPRLLRPGPLVLDLG
jgi:tRNA threonylcarbamoyl adenosine modification protein (Sua5/YciO/YrdC/YwlC family)